MKRLIAPLVVLLTLSLIAALLVQERTSQKFDDKVGELSRALLKSQQQTKQLTVKLADSEQKQKILQTESEELRSRIKEYAAAAESEQKADAAPSPTPSAEPKNGFSGMLKKMMADPEMKKAMAQQQMSFMRQYYNDFIKQAGLTPQEADKLFEILSKKQEAAMEAGSKVIQDGVKGATPPKDYQDELKALLGDQRAAQFTNYEKTLPDRITLGQINQQLSSSGTQLNDAQTNSLLQIYSEERANSPAPSFKPDPANPTNFSDAEMEQYFQQQADLNQRIALRANSILTPQQLEKLLAAQKQIIDMQKMGMKMARQMMK